MDERHVDSVSSLAGEIAAHSFDKHVMRAGEFGNDSNEKYGIKLGIDNEKDFREHIKKTLESDETKCFKVSDGIEIGTMYFYSEQSNTLIVVPGKKALEPTCYRPPENVHKFQTKIIKTAKQQGYMPEIKRGIYDLMPELTKELAKSPNHQKAEKIRRAKELYRQWTDDGHTPDKGRGREVKR